jgi:hypothetical protein
MGIFPSFLPFASMGFASMGEHPHRTIWQVLEGAVLAVPFSETAEKV